MGQFYKIGVFILTFFTIIPLASKPRCNGPEDSLPLKKEMSRENLLNFFDKKIPELRKKHGVAGLTIIAVRPDQVLYKKGFGYSNIEKETNVHPDQDLFRVGSISKLFVWISLMQLEQQGRLNLNDPVEKYIDFRFPETFEKKIRIIDLMNHTPGFEDRLPGLFVPTPEDQLPLHDVLSNHVPERIFPPGEIVAYSNYGAILASYVVERISGLSFEEYVQKNIFHPLKMQSSTFAQDSQHPLHSSIAGGYAGVEGQWTLMPFEVVQGTGAGGMSATASDMGHFLQSILKEGKPILNQTTFCKMRETSFHYNEKLNGFAHGWIEMGHPGLSVFGHGGDTAFFHSLLLVFPGKDIGIFISTNSSTGALFNIDLITQMEDEFIQFSHQLDQKAKEDLKQYEGSYLSLRAGVNDYTSLASLLMIVPVQADSDGLIISNPLTGEEKKYFPEGDGIFISEDGRDRFGFFIKDSTINVVWNFFPVITFRKADWYMNPALHLSLLSLGFFAILAGLIVPPTGLGTIFLRKRLKSQTGALPTLPGLMTSLFIIAQFVLIGFLIGPGMALPHLSWIHFLPEYAALLFFIWMSIVTVRSWINKGGFLWVRIFHTSVNLGYGFYFFEAMLWNFM